MAGAPVVTEEKPSIVERLRAQARAIWRGEVAALGDFSGLCSEAAVRARLVAGAKHAAEQLEESDPRRAALTLPFEHAPPLSLLEATEGLLTRHPNLEAPAGPLLLVQCLAGRLGRWAVRAEEVPDARIARALFRDTQPAQGQTRAALIERGAAALAQGAHREAIRRYLEADRILRTPDGLLRTAIALCRLSDHVGALWAIRAALLEPPSSFESPEARGAAETLERRLREVVDVRRAAPLDPDESKVLRGLSVRDWTPLRRQQVIDRRPVEPRPLELPPLPVVPKAEFRTITVVETTARTLLPVEELITTEIIPPLLRGEIDPSVFDEPLILVSDSFEIDAPFEERSPIAWPLELESAPPFRAEVRALRPEEATAPVAPEIQPLHARFSGTSAVALKQTIQKQRVYEKTEQIRVRGFEAVLLDPAGD